MGNSMAVVEGTLEVGDKDGSLLDTTIVTQTDGDLAHREAVILADPEINDARVHLRLFNEGVTQEYGVPITGPELRAMVDLMEKILTTNMLTNKYLSMLCQGHVFTKLDLEEE